MQPVRTKLASCKLITSRTSLQCRPPPGTGPSRSTTSLPCVALLLPVPLRPTRGCGSSQTYVSYRKMAPAVECLTVARTRRTSSKSMTCLWPTLSDITMAIEHLSGYTSRQLGSLTQLRTALKDCCSFWIMLQTSKTPILLPIPNWLSGSATPPP